MWISWFGWSEREVGPIQRVVTNLYHRWGYGFVVTPMVLAERRGPVHLPVVVGIWFWKPGWPMGAVEQNTIPTDLASSGCNHSTSSIRHSVVIATNIALPIRVLIAIKVNFILVLVTIVVLITIVILTASIDLVATGITFNAVLIMRSIVFFVIPNVTSINDISSVVLVTTSVQ
jgi:hypothetical protein